MISLCAILGNSNALICRRSLETNAFGYRLRNVPSGRSSKFCFDSTSMDSWATDALTKDSPIDIRKTLVSANQVFELGFFSPDNSAKQYLGIWFKNVTIRKIIWVANRESRLSISDTSCSLTIVDDGNLRILDGMILGESFDYPRNSLLPGMKLGTNAPEEFVAGLSAEQPPQALIRLMPANSQEGAYLTVNLLTSPNNYRRLYIKLNGVLQMIYWDNEENMLDFSWEASENPCDVYGVCGNFAICKNNKSPICDCLKGFVSMSNEEWSKSNWTRGCVRRSELLCEKSESSLASGKPKPDKCLSKLTMTLVVEREIVMLMYGDNTVCTSATDTLTKDSPIDIRKTLVSANQVFELGFFSPDNSAKQYLGICSSLTIVDDGNLRILDGERNTVWSTNITLWSNKTTAKLTDTGDFCLNDTISGMILLESFDYPSNGLLPGMKLGTNGKTQGTHFMTSWKSDDDPTPGNFVVGLSEERPPQIFTWNGSKPHRRGVPRDGGKMIYLDDDNKMGWEEPNDPCDIMAFVSNEEWGRSNWTRGCVRRSELLCEKNESSLASGKTKPDNFQVIRGVKLADHYLYFPYKDPDGCKEWCMDNCSWMAYIFVIGLYCMAWTEDLIDIEQFPFGGEDLYLRLSHSESGLRKAIEDKCLSPWKLGLEAVSRESHLTTMVREEVFMALVNFDHKETHEELKNRFQTL
nr:G-type lectin S-receptor-like serine/threonine-protein kinase [Tanacetum cinerariifolium]